MILILLALLIPPAIITVGAAVEVFCRYPKRIDLFFDLLKEENPKVSFSWEYRLGYNSETLIPHERIKYRLSGNEKSVRKMEEEIMLVAQP